MKKLLSLYGKGSYKKSLEREEKLNHQNGTMFARSSAKPLEKVQKIPHDHHPLFGMVWWEIYGRVPIYIYARKEWRHCCLRKYRVKPGCKVLEQHSVCWYLLGPPIGFCGDTFRESDSAVTRSQCVVFYSEGRLDFGIPDLNSLDYQIENKSKEIVCNNLTVIWTL